MASPCRHIYKSHKLLGIRRIIINLVSVCEYYSGSSLIEYIRKSILLSYLGVKQLFLGTVSIERCPHLEVSSFRGILREVVHWIEFPCFVTEVVGNIVPGITACTVETKPGKPGQGGKVGSCFEGMRPQRGYFTSWTLPGHFWSTEHHGDITAQMPTNFHNLCVCVCVCV